MVAIARVGGFLQQLVQELRYRLSELDRVRPRHVFLLAFIISTIHRVLRTMVGTDHIKILWILRDRILSRGVLVVSLGSLYKCHDYSCYAVVMPSFEKWMWSYLKIPPDGVFIDVGAHVGKYSIALGRRLRRGLVVAIEPMPSNIKTLVEAIKLNGLGNVVVVSKAAWSTNTTLNLYIPEAGSVGGSAKHTGSLKIEVEAETIDSIVSRLELSRVDLIKIDVEGAEIEVIKGSINTINKYNPKIIVEVWRDNEKIFRELMMRLGYICETISIPEEHVAYYHCSKKP